MQGWTPDFIPKITGEALDESLIDELIAINGADAMGLARELARKEGIFVGTTSGATLAGALKICERAEEGASVLAMLPDTGERYLTTPLFDGVGDDMNDEELEISRSTPGARFDAPSAPAPAPAAAAPVAADVEAVAFVEQVLADKSQPVVLFALEWCEFCWSARRLFSQLGVEYRSVDIDSAAMQDKDWGARVRAAVSAKSGMITIPQIFVGGELIGGCSELFDAFKSGALQKKLKAAGAPFKEDAAFDPYGLLPKWLHKR